MSLTQANNLLAINLHRLLSQEYENIFFSPFGISTAMGMLLCAAEGETASEMRVVLGHEDAGVKKEEVVSIFEQQLFLLLPPSDTHTLSCANCLLSRKSLHVKDQYKNIVKKSFQALMLEVDFEKENEKAAYLINEWVREKTNDMIPMFVKSLDPTSAVILLNAVYFKGSWMNPFDKEGTCAQTFYNYGMENNAKEVEMMHIKNLFFFYQEESFQILELPYVGAEIVMMIILPRDRKGLDKVESTLSPSFVLNLRKDLWQEDVKVSLPRFRLEYTKSLVPYFSELGMKRVFRQGAELTVASDSPDIVVSDILHRAVIDVNEEGSDASIATKTAVNYCTLIDGAEFIADHPFIFAIQNVKTDLILFMGRVNEL